MSLAPAQEKILEQMVKQERMLSKLYRIFSAQFPQDHLLWENLSKEEEVHAGLIEKLIEASRKGIVLFHEGKIKSASLNIFLSRLEGILQKAERGEFTLSSALTYAVDYESSLIEKNVFFLFDSASAKAKNTLKILQSETTKHVERIRTAQKGLQPQI